MCIKYDLDEGEKFEIKPVYSNKKYYMKYLIGYIYCFLNDELCCCVVY